MENFKNPTALLFQRMANATKGQSGSLASLMQNFFAANYGLTQLPKICADFIIFDQLAAAGATNLSFFNDQYTAARSNFPGGSFVAPNSEHMLILGVKMLSAANASVPASDWQPGVEDAALKNGQLDIQVNGVKQITSLPLTAFDPNEISATTSGRTDGGRGMFYLYEPIVLLGQQQLVANAKFPTGSGTANINLRMELHGIRFIGN